MANAIPVSKQSEKVEKKGPEIVGKLPEGFEVPQHASRVVVLDNGTVRVDLGFPQK